MATKKTNKKTESKETSKETSNTDNDASKEKEEYRPQVQAIDAEKHFLANGGTKRVIARACYVLAKGNIAKTATLFDRSGGLVRKATCKGTIAHAKQESRNYAKFGGSEAGAREENHKAFNAAMDYVKTLLVSDNA